MCCTVASRIKINPAIPVFPLIECNIGLKLITVVKLLLRNWLKAIHIEIARQVCVLCAAQEKG